MKEMKFNLTGLQCLKELAKHILLFLCGHVSLKTDIVCSELHRRVTSTGIISHTGLSQIESLWEYI